MTAPLRRASPIDTTRNLLQHPNIIYEVLYRGKIRDIKVNLADVPEGYTPFIIVVSKSSGQHNFYRIPLEISGNFAEQEVHRKDLARLYETFRLSR